MPETSARESVAARWAELDFRLTEYMRKNDLVLQSCPEGNDRAVLLKMSAVIAGAQDMIDELGIHIEQDPAAAWDSFFATVDESRLNCPRGPVRSGWETVWAFMREITAPPMPTDRRPLRPETVAILNKLWYETAND